MTPSTKSLPFRRFKSLDQLVEISSSIRIIPLHSKSFTIERPHSREVKLQSSKGLLKCGAGLSLRKPGPKTQ